MKHVKNDFHVLKHVEEDLHVFKHVEKGMYMFWTMLKMCWEGHNCFETWVKYVEKDLCNSKHAQRGFTCLATSLTCHEGFKCIKTCQKHVEKDLYMLWNMLVRSYMFWNIFNTCQGKKLCFEIWLKHVGKDLHALKYAQKNWNFLITCAKNDFDVLKRVKNMSRRIYVL
jgi:hypothetical protein